VRTCSARDGAGISEVWDLVLRHREVHESTGELKTRRASQARDWMWSDVSENLLSALQSDSRVRQQIPLMEAAASEGRIPPTVAARQLLELFLEQKN
jgi:LAO/AO transport system kinase